MNSFFGKSKPCFTAKHYDWNYLSFVFYFCDCEYHGNDMLKFIFRLIR